MEEQTRPFLLPVEVQLDGVDFFVVPGGKLEIEVVVINHQQRDDMFEVSLRGVPLGWVTLNPAVLEVGAGQRMMARLTIEPPAVASASTGVYPIVVRAASQPYPDVSTETGMTLRVGAYETGSRVGILMDSLQYHVDPGTAVTVPFILINQGLSEDNLRLSVEGLPISWVSTPTPMVRLQPGERREVSLLVQPPRSPQSRAGRTPFTIQVISQAGADQITSVDCLLTVAAFSQFTSDLSPHRLEPDQPARVRIFNQGNIQEAYSIAWQNPGAGLEFTSAEPGPVRVQPGEAAAIDFVVHPRHRRIFGGPSLTPFTVVVQSSTGETQNHTGESLSVGLVPIWVLPVVLVLCLSMVCVAGLIWNRGRPQESSATLTVAAQTATVFAATQTAMYNQTAAALTGQQDTDGDALTNSQELQIGTNPDSPDTDADRLLDGEEVRLGTNPLQPDSDGDGLLDGADLDPLDPANPRATATALAGLPTATFTATATTAPIVPTATIVPANTPVPTVPVPATVAPTVAPTAALTATTAPVVLPANSALVFESNREGPSEIYSLTASTGALTRLTISPAVDNQPYWSPDGSRVVFTTNRDGNNEVYVMNADGTAVTNLSNNAANDQYPVWSPDGSLIAFTTDRDGNQEIYSMGATGTDPINLTNNPAQDLYPAWYQDSNRIVFASGRDGNLEIYAMNADGSAPTNLTNSATNETFPSVPRTGGQVAFVTDRDGNAEIYVMNADGSNQTNRSNNPAIDTYPAFNPDGSWLAFTTNRDVNQEVYIMRADGTSVGNVTRSPAEDLFARWR